MTEQFNIFTNNRTMNDKKTPFRIGIILPPLGPLNIPALQYLILHLNTLQNHVEFEFMPVDLTDSFLRQLKPRKEISWEKCQSQIKPFSERYSKFYYDNNNNYGLTEGLPDYFIVISLAKLSSRWYSVGENNFSVLFLGDWKRYMAPPSLLEIIVSLVITLSILALSPRIDHSRTHLSTKGCVGDFNSELRDVRYKTLQSFICSHCIDICRQNGVEEKVRDLVKLLDKEWIGDTKNPNSPAGIVAKLGYDLFLTKGVAPTRWETLTSILQQDGTKELIKVISSVCLAAILLWLGLKR